MEHDANGRCDLRDSRHIAWVARFLGALIALTLIPQAPEAIAQRAKGESNEQEDPLLLGLQRIEGTPPEFLEALDEILEKSPRIDTRGGTGQAFELRFAKIDLAPPDTAEEREQTREAMRGLALEAILRFEPTSNGVLVTVIGPAGNIMQRFVQPTPADGNFEEGDVRAALQRAFAAVIPEVDRWRARHKEQALIMARRAREERGAGSGDGKPVRDSIEGASPDPAPLSSTRDSPGDKPTPSSTDKDTSALSEEAMVSAAPEATTTVEEHADAYTTSNGKVAFASALSAGIWTGFLSFTEQPSSGVLGGPQTTRQPGRGISLSYSSVSLKYPALDLEASVRLQPDGDETDFYAAGEMLYAGAWQLKGRLGMELDTAFRVKVWPGEQASIIAPFGIGVGLRWLNGKRLTWRAGVHVFYLTAPTRGFGAGWMAWGRARVLITEHLFLDWRPTFAIHVIDPGPTADSHRLRTLEVPFQLGYRW